jgi:hypothetical protein
MNTEPRIVGIIEIPKELKSFETFSNKVALKLPDIPAGQAMEIAFADEDDLRLGRKQILMASMRIYGVGKIKTGSNGSHLFVWMKDPSNKIFAQIRDNFAQELREAVDA